MASQLPKYRMQDGLTVLGAAYFNRVFGDIDLRLVSLEDLRADWEGAVDELRDFGLLRLDDSLAPVLGQLNDDVAQVQAMIADLPEVALKADLAQPDTQALSYTDGRLTGISESINGAARVVTLSYDGEGRLAQVQTDYQGRRRTETLTYDEGGTLQGMTATEVDL